MQFEHISNNETAELFRLATSEPAFRVNNGAPHALVEALNGKFRLVAENRLWFVVHVNGDHTTRLASMTIDQHPVAAVRAVDALNFVDFTYLGNGIFEADDNDGFSVRRAGLETTFRVALNHHMEHAPTRAPQRRI